MQQSYVNTCSFLLLGFVFLSVRSPNGHSITREIRRKPVCCLYIYPSLRLFAVTNAVCTSDLMVIMLSIRQKTTHANISAQLDWKRSLSDKAMKYFGWLILVSRLISIHKVRDQNWPFQSNVVFTSSSPSRKRSNAHNPTQWSIETEVLLRCSVEASGDRPEFVVLATKTSVIYK